MNGKDFVARRQRVMSPEDSLENELQTWWKKWKEWSQWKAVRLDTLPFFDLVFLKDVDILHLSLHIFRLSSIISLHFLHIYSIFSLEFPYIHGAFPVESPWARRLALLHWLPPARWWLVSWPSSQGREVWWGKGGDTTNALYIFYTYIYIYMIYDYT